MWVADEVVAVFKIGEFYESEVVVVFIFRFLQSYPRYPRQTKRVAKKMIKLE